MTTRTATVAELEAKILDGGSVSPAEMAAAVTAESAHGRIASLGRQREANLAQAERAERAQAAAKPLKAQLSRLAADDSIQRAEAAFKAATEAYIEAVRDHNEQVRQIYGGVLNANQIAPGVNLGVFVRTTDGGVDGPDGSVRLLPDWAITLRNLFEQAVAEGREDTYVQ